MVESRWLGLLDAAARLQTQEALSDEGLAGAYKDMLGERAERCDLRPCFRCGTSAAGSDLWPELRTQLRARGHAAQSLNLAGLHLLVICRYMD